jgi:hypothetical protein
VFAPVDSVLHRQDAVSSGQAADLPSRVIGKEDATTSSPESPTVQPDGAQQIANASWFELENFTSLAQDRVADIGEFRDECRVSISLVTKKQGRLGERRQNRPMG